MEALPKLRFAMVEGLRKVSEVRRTSCPAGKGLQKRRGGGVSGYPRRAFSIRMGMDGEEPVTSLWSSHMMDRKLRDEAGRVREERSICRSLREG